MMDVAKYIELSWFPQNKFIMINLSKYIKMTLISSPGFKFSVTLPLVTPAAASMN